jgi:hypothetical protein
VKSSLMAGVLTIRLRRLAREVVDWVRSSTQEREHLPFYLRLLPTMEGLLVGGNITAKRRPNKPYSLAPLCISHANFDSLSSVWILHRLRRKSKAASLNHPALLPLSETTQAWYLYHKTRLEGSWRACFIGLKNRTAVKILPE